MLIAGVVLSSSAVAVLARCLQRAGEAELADEIGFAVDANRNEIRLGRSEKDALLLVLGGCPPVLQPLKDALEMNQRRVRGL